MLNRPFDLHDWEREEVQKYKQTSEIYKKCQQTVITSGNPVKIARMEKMEKAESIAEMLALAANTSEIALQHMEGIEGSVVRTVNNALLAGASFFSAEANFDYYDQQLHAELLKVMEENNHFKMSIQSNAQNRGLG